MKKSSDKIKEDNIIFEIHKCEECKEEILDMNQLKKLAKKYRTLKLAREVTFSQWGNSLAVRVSKQLTNDLNIKQGDKGIIYKEGESLKIIKA